MRDFYKHQKRYAAALAFAGRAHRGQKRKYRGEPYITHPMAVAGIIMRLVPDHTLEMVQAALLHDVVEDSDDYSINDIQQIFGETIARIVDGLTKISATSKKTDISLQAENFRKMLLYLFIIR